MKALSIRQPWAWAIIHAGKDIEERTRRLSYRGPVLIHAAKVMTPTEYEDFLAFSRDRFRFTFPATRLPAGGDLQFGGIIGQAEIVDCVSDHPSPWFTGSLGLVLANPKPLPFRPLLGQLGLFEVEMGVAQ
jgi:hypothetical protein